MTALSQAQSRDNQGMTAKAKLLAQVEQLSEADAAVARIVIEPLDVASDEPKMVGIPEAWQTFEDGTSVPNWVAGLDDARASPAPRAGPLSRGDWI